MVGTSSVPFPDERYRTIAVEWRRSRSQELSTPEQRQAMRMEAEQLLARSRPVRVGPARPGRHAARRSWRPLVLDVRAQGPARGAASAAGRPRRCRSSTVSTEQRAQLSDIKPPPPALARRGRAHRWIYYPWRRAVVRLLGPRSFGMLRLDRNRNKLTRAEQARQRTLRIGVVGLSAGHSIAHVLAMEGLAGELRLADFDTRRAVQSQPHSGQRARPRREQGRGGRPSHRGDRPVPARDDDPRGHPSGQPREPSSTASIWSLRSATRST